MRKIFKYPLLLDFDGQEQFLEVHQNARLVTTQIQAGKLFAWFEVETDNDLVEVKFRVYRTGFQIHDEVDYVGTVQNQGFVYHVYAE